MFLDTQEQERLTHRIAESCERARRTGDGGRPKEAFEQLTQTCLEELEIEFSVLSMLDAVSAAHLLEDTARVLGWSMILEAMGEIEDDAVTARKHFEQALHVAAAHRERVGPGKPRLEAALERLLGNLN